MSIVLPNVCAAVSSMEETLSSVLSYEADVCSSAVVFQSSMELIPQLSSKVANFGLYADTVEKFCIH